MSTPLDDLRAAGVNVRLSPAHPFSVLLVSPFTESDKVTLRQALAEPDTRALIVDALLKKMGAATFDAFLDATVQARVDAGTTWADEPWQRWRTVLDDEDDRRRYGSAAPAIEIERRRRQTEKERLLVKLQQAGPKGVLNGELEAGEVGRRYSARLEELRKEGWQIDTQRVDARSFRFILKGRQMFKEPAA